MTPDQCKGLAKAIVDEKPDWFKDGKTAILVSEMVDFVPAGEMSYYKLALPVSADSEVDPDDDSRYITGVAGDCKFVNCLPYAPFGLSFAPRTIHLLYM